MIVTGTIQASKIIPRRKDTIDGIRITFHKKEMDEAFELGYALMDKGYEVFMQPGWNDKLFGCRTFKSF